MKAVKGEKLSAMCMGSPGRPSTLFNPSRSNNQVVTYDGVLRRVVGFKLQNTGKEIDGWIIRNE